MTTREGRRVPRTDLGEALHVLRRNPAFRRAYAAQLISFGGDWFTTVALLGLILDLTGDPFMQSLALVANLVPFALISPVAGVVADRFDRRLVMISADVVRALLALGLLLVHSRSTLWIAFAVLIGISISTAFFEPASSAALPNLVRDEDLPMANVLIGSAWGTMLAVGAALGGVVTALLGRQAAFIGDAVSFAVSAALLLSIRAPFQAAARGSRRHITILTDVRELLRFAREEKRVASLMIVKGGFGFGGGVLALLAVMAKDAFRAGDSGIGVLMSVRGAGALLGPFLFRRIFGAGDRALFRAISVAFLTFAFGYTIFGVSPALWLAAAATGFAHLGGGAQWTMSTIGLQRFSPDAIRGRVFSADYMLVTLTLGGSIALAGALAGRFGPRPVALGFASVSALWGLTWTLLTRRYWPKES